MILPLYLTERNKFYDFSTENSTKLKKFFLNFNIDNKTSKPGPKPRLP